MGVSSTGGIVGAGRAGCAGRGQQRASQASQSARDKLWKPLSPLCVQDGANIDLDAHRKGKCCVLKTSTRQTIFLPVPGLVEPDLLKPADLVGVNKDSYLILGE